VGEDSRAVFKKTAIFEGLERQAGLISEARVGEGPVIVST
jgi:hypothetical protein